MIRWLVALSLMAGCSTATARDLALVKIRLDRFVDLYDPADACKPEDSSCIQFIFWQKYRVTLLRTYAGRVPHRTFSVMMLGHAVTADGAELYAVVEPAEGGVRFHTDGRDLFPGEDYVVVRDRANASAGFCIPPDEEDLKESGLAAAADALRREHPCKNP